MLVHILGWATVAAEVGVSVGVAAYLWNARKPWTWQRKLRAPKAVEFTVQGDDWTGLV